MRLAVQCKAAEPKKILMMGEGGALKLFGRRADRNRNRKHARRGVGGGAAKLGSGPHAAPLTRPFIAPLTPTPGGTRFIGLYLARQLVEQVGGRGAFCREAGGWVRAGARPARATAFPLLLLLLPLLLLLLLPLLLLLLLLCMFLKE